jgi:5,5'-dehydrodivanillate O-demethylase
LKNRVNIGGYPVQEMGGLIFAYLGEGPVPVLPPYDFLVWPNSLRQIGVTELPCNWLQCHENSADPFHNTYLHGYFFKYQLERMGMLSERAGDEGAHRTFVSIHGTDHADGIAFTRDTYGFRKGIKMSKERGAKEDSIRWFPYNIYPYFSRSGGGLRTQINIRVPIDDTHTLHLHYGIFNIPDTTVPEQSPIPYYEAPIFDEQGQPILDYVMAQDAAAWWSQGELTDRSREQLGATDLAIIEFRKIIEEQITAVEEGRDPMNVFRDPAAVPSSINFDPPIGAEVRNLAQSGSSIDKINVSRSMFHRGYSNDDIDRYGPITPQIAELMRAAEERTS